MSLSTHERQNTSLSHIILRLILIGIGRDHNGDKDLPYNTITFSGLELKTTD